MLLEQLWHLGLQPLREFSEVVQAAHVGNERHRLGFTQPCLLADRSAQAIMTA